MILSFADITSEPVEKKVKEQDATEASNIYLLKGDDYYASQILRRFNLTPETAQDPISQSVKNVVMLYVCVLVATDNVGLELTALNDYNYADAWKARLKAFQDQLKMAEDSLLLSDVALVDPETDVPLESTFGRKAINRYG